MVSRSGKSPLVQLLPEVFAVGATAEPGHRLPRGDSPIYSFCYAGANNTSIAVNITMTKVKTGYTFTGS